MFTVYHSNQIDVLKSLLVELIRLNPLDNPFEKEQILVQSPGMSQWLKMALAQEFGVAANIDFPLPATFIWDMFTHALPDVPKRSAFNKEAMTWKIMHLLPSQLDQAEYAPLKQYLNDDDDDSKLYQLSEKIADIFDGYLVYRPEWIAQWESDHKVAELNDEHPWQPLLWQRLYDYTVSLDQSPYHRANLYEHFIEAVERYIASAGQEHQFDHLPKRLFVFGITSLPPRYLDALKAIGEHIDVHLMFTNPSRYYWGEVRDRRFLAKLAAKQRQHVEWHDDHSQFCGTTEQLNCAVDDFHFNDDASELHTDMVGNSLLASMGKLGRDNLFLLSQLESHEIEAFVEINNDSLLHQLQADILNLLEHQNDELFASSEHKQVLAQLDPSLSLHACHSPMREVEVLHDQLLAMFDANPTLKPRDIIVMVADINAYSPAIQAVFGNAPGERYIPFSISDRSADQESPILAAFMQLVNLPNTRCLASELLELLEIPSVLARFELTEKQFEQIKLWVEEVGIRWGADAQTSQEFDLPSYEQNTWLFGIQRMLLGYAMPDSVGVYHGEMGDVAAFDEVQGMNAELAGKLAHFVERIIHYRQHLNQTQSIAHWHTTLLAVLDDFFAVDIDGEMVLKSIRDALIALQEQLNDAGYKADIAPRIMAQYLQDRLSGTRISQRFLAGQVNFCTLMPMRSIPFKTVCLLGMNEGVYPRSVPPESFDLMNGRTKAGDRSRRDDDRYLFLEALLSAQQTLYISYVGRSIQDNTERMPSVLVSELLEYCHQNYCWQGDESLSCDQSGDRFTQALITFHPMVPFSEHAFAPQGQETSNTSYAKEWLPVVNQLQSEMTLTASSLSPYLLDKAFPLELDLVELQRFWRLPVAYFYNRRLKVSFDVTEMVLEDDEPFILNGLESYLLRDQLLTTLLAAELRHDDCEQKDSALFDVIGQHRAQGNLPIGAFGEIEFTTNRAQAEDLAKEIAFYATKQCDDIEINLTLNALGDDKPIHLSGWLTQHYSSGLLRYRSGKVNAKYLLAAWIDHLCCAAMEHNKATHIFGYDKKEGVVHHTLPPLLAAEALSLLNELVCLFYTGMDRPLAYFPDTALAGIESNYSRKKWADDMNDENQTANAYKKMASKFNDGYSFSGEGSNDYIQRVWPQWSDELAKEVYLLAQSVIMAPRLACEKQDEL